MLSAVSEVEVPYPTSEVLNLVQSSAAVTLANYKPSAGVKGDHEALPLASNEGTTFNSAR